MGSQETRGTSAWLHFPNYIFGGKKCATKLCGGEIPVPAPDPTSHPLSESLGDAGPLPSSSCLDVSTPEGNANPAQGPCPHRNGGLRMPRRDGAKRRPCCQGDAKGDVVLLATTWPHHKEHGHGFPLPATELGATALVTTKTTQECMGEERL